MNSKSIKTSHIIVFIILILIFSAFPFIFSLLFDKSSLWLAHLTIWYAIIPPVIIFLLAYLLYRKEDNLLLAMGRTWLFVGLWFLMQLLLIAISGLSILLRLLSFPATTVGNSGFIAGAVIFILGGILFIALGNRRSIAIPYRKGMTLSANIAILLVVVFIAIFALRSTHLSEKPLIEDSKVPAEEQIFGWIEDTYNFGIRRTGSSADLRAIDYIQEKLKSFGITDIRTLPFTFDYWESKSWKLSILEAAGKAHPMTCFYVPYSGPTGTDGITAEVIYLGKGSQEDFEGADVKGKIILVDMPPTNISWDRMKVFSYMAYDPDNSTAGWEHPYPIGWMFKYHHVYDLAVKHGVAGIIGILEGYPDMGKFTYYAPYDGTLRPIPSIYVMEKDGKRIKALIEGGANKANLVLTAKVLKQGGKTATIYGIIPGKSERSIIIHSHHDAPWRSGIEDSSGVGMVLSLAKYYSQIPSEQLERTLIFMFTGSHMVGSKSNYDFIERRTDIMENVLMDICIEHISDDLNPPHPSSGKPEPRGAFITENPVVLGLYARLLPRHGIIRTLIFPTRTPLGVPTDAQPFHNKGYHIHSIISGPTWLFDDDDTLDRVARDQLVPLTRKYIDFISHLNLKSDCMLTFNLNTWVIILMVLVFTPLAVLGSRKKD